MEAAALAQKECGMELRPYMPHLSLLYADLDDKKKEEVGLFIGSHHSNIE